LGDPAEIMETASFPPTSLSPFPPPDLYGDRIKSIDKLRKDHVASAKQSGFFLVTSTNGLKCTLALIIVFPC